MSFFPFFPFVFTCILFSSTHCTPPEEEKLYTKKINKLHATTPLWKASPHIRILWFTLLMYRDDRGFINASFDQLKELSELKQNSFNDAFFYLCGESENNNYKYIIREKDGIKICCFDKQEQKLIDSMPLWKERSEKGFNEYIRITQEAFNDIIHDYEFLLELKEFYPHIKIMDSVRKTFTHYWGTEKAWIKRRRKRANTFNWRETIANTIHFNLVKINRDSPDYELDFLRKKWDEQRNNIYA